MTDKAEKLIADIKKNGRQTENSYGKLFDLAINPIDAYSFAREYLKSFDESATIFDDILSYIDKEQFSELIELSLEILKINENENAENVISNASLQFPELLHNHLQLIFELKPNGNSFFANYPWRNLSKEKIDYFKNQLIDSKTVVDDKIKLFKCLLETRDLETVNFVYTFALNNNLFDTNNLLSYIELVGYTKRDGRIESYCPNTARHFSFQKNYFSSDIPIHISKEQHPTWNLKANEIKYKFGGVIKDDEKNPFIHLITFDEIPSGLKISELKSLTLGMHIREVNEYISVFYQHDKLGKPSRIGETTDIEVYLDFPIKETEISFADTPNRWKFQNWGISNSRENLFRLGGEPTWIQNAQVLTCPISGEKMDFLFQLDTSLPDIEDEEVYFGSGGICYAFWCDKTKVSGYLIQST